MLDFHFRLEVIEVKGHYFKAMEKNMQLSNFVREDMQNCSIPKIK